MWFRFLTLSFLNVAAMLATVVVLGLLLPLKTPAFVLMLAVWALSFVMTFVFSEWALSKKLPTREDTLLLAVFHLVAFMTLYLSYGIILSDRGPWVLVSLELIAQIALDILAIFFAAYRMRRRKIQSVLGEGLTI